MEKRLVCTVVSGRLGKNGIVDFGIRPTQLEILRKNRDGGGKKPEIFSSISAHELCIPCFLEVCARTAQLRSP